MAYVWAKDSDNEVRYRFRDRETGAEVTDGTVTASIVKPSGEVVASARALSYDANKLYDPGKGDGCYFCTVSAAESDEQGDYTVTVTAVKNSRQLVTVRTYSCEVDTGS